MSTEQEDRTPGCVECRALAFERAAGHICLNCGAVVGSSPLIERGEGRPKGGYRHDGERVPSVTTILGRCKESGGLIGWAWKMGAEGISLDDARKGTADVGSCVHDMIEAHLHDADAAEIMTRYRGAGVDMLAVDEAMGAYLRWREESRLTVTATEVALTVPGWGGTVDAMARDEAGRLWVLDWKSSNAVYVDMLAQIAAYAHLWTAARGEAVHGGRLLRVSKGGSVHEHRYERRHLDLGWGYFEAARGVYDADKLCKAVL